MLKDAAFGLYPHLDTDAFDMVYRINWEKFLEKIPGTFKLCVTKNAGTESAFLIQYTHEDEKHPNDLTLGDVDSEAFNCNLNSRGTVGNPEEPYRSTGFFYDMTLGSKEKRRENVYCD
jgi:hypothetical protein